MSRQRAARRPSSYRPGRNGTARSGFGIFVQELGTCLRHCADAGDAGLAAAAAEALFDTEEDCELVVLWDYSSNDPRQVWRLTPAVLPRWDAAPGEAGAESPGAGGGDAQAAPPDDTGTQGAAKALPAPSWLSGE